MYNLFDIITVLILIDASVKTNFERNFVQTQLEPLIF